MRHPQHGFTLIEMLVALSVAVLLVSLVYGGVRLGYRSLHALDGQVDHNEVMRIGWQYLHDALSRARAIRNPARAGDPTSFHGTTETVTFIADLPAAVGLGGLTEVTVKPIPGTSSRSLRLTRRRFDANETTPSPEFAENEAVLVEDLHGIRIEYFGEGDRDETPAWHGHWTGHDTLPRLVRISVQPRDANPWPTIIASPSGLRASSLEAEHDDDHGADSDFYDGDASGTPQGEH